MKPRPVVPVHRQPEKPHHPLKTFLDRIITVPAYLPVALYVAIVGLLGLLNGGLLPTSHLHHALPPWLVVCWSVAFFLGGLAAVSGGIGGRSRIESSGLMFMFTGLIFYGAAIIYASGEVFPVLLVTSCLASMCAIRLRVLALARKAQEVAAELHAQREV